VQLAAGAIKEAVPDLLVASDVCLCEYTTHGHCGVLREDGSVDNDATLELLARTAVSHAAPGPTSSHLGHDGWPRRSDPPGAGLRGLPDTPILAYSAKFASALRPFREAAGSTPAFGDRPWLPDGSGQRTGGGEEAILDVEEGADMIMVKPALAYGDLISAVKQATGLPVAAYNVSGEYAMVKAAAAPATSTSVRQCWRSSRRCAGPGPTRSSPITQRTQQMASRADLTTDADADLKRAAAATPRSAAARMARRFPWDDVDRRLLNLMQGKFPIVSEPYRHVAGWPRSPRGGHEPCQHLLEKADHPPGDADLRHPRLATPRCSWQQGRPDHPHRAAQVINAHPGVSHNYLRNHEFNLWFTIATEPDSQLGLQGPRRARPRVGRRVDPSAADAEAVQDRMDSKWRAAPTPLLHDRATEPIELEAQPYDERDIAVIRACRATCRS